MHLLGAFELEIRPGTPDLPAAVTIALLRYTRGEDGRLFSCDAMAPRSCRHRPVMDYVLAGRAGTSSRQNLWP